MRWLSAVAVACSVTAGCADDAAETGPGSGGGGGEPPLAPGAGVPSDACGPGFVHDGEFGCHAILPADACPPGLIAVPGDESCRPVAECGDGSWGTIPIEGNTQHVDRDYTGGGSEGTSAQPWLTVQEGVDAADSGAIVAVAAGTYFEHVFIDRKTVRLWGRCPELVTITGPTSAQASIQISRANDCEVHNLSTQSTAAIGIVVTDALATLIDAVWLHDSSDPAIQAVDTLGPIQLTLTNSLIENVNAFGIVAAGADVTIERSLIRDTRIGGPGQRGRALLVTPHPETNTRSTVRVIGSLIERNHDASLVAQAGDLHVEATAIRDSLPHSDGLFGFGILAQSDPLLGRSIVTIEASTIERSRTAAVALDSCTMTALHTTIRDTSWQEADTRYGRGAQVQTLEGERAAFNLTASLVTDSKDIGVFVIDADASLDRAVVRRTTPDGPGRYGDGVCVMSSALGATGALIGSQIHDNVRAGVSNFGADVAIGDNLLLCNTVQLNGETVPGPFRYEDLGGNVCGCAAETTECAVLSANLEPPEAP